MGDYSNFYGRGYSTIFGSATEKKSLGDSIPLIFENGKFLTDCHKKFATDGLKANGGVSRIILRMQRN